MSGPLVNLGNLTKPATVLVERISDAVGGIAMPWQMRRVARAEADAEIIKANARVKITQIERRALVRLVREEGKKQGNIEAITAKALPRLTMDAKPEGIEADWIAHFFDRCRLISDEEMQSLWANILAGEANEPGKFSKQTVNLMATLDKRDAELFTRLCCFVWGMPDLVPVIPMLATGVPGSTTNVMEFGEHMHLDSLGLIRFDNTSPFVRISDFPTGGPRLLIAAYFGKVVCIHFPEGQSQLFVGCTLLTRVGRELALICKPAPSDEHFMQILWGWAGANFTIWSPVPRVSAAPVINFVAA
jgi:hypothetical protein